MVLLAGEAGIGKSVLAITLTLALATGREFLGRPCPVSRVLYYDQENSRPDGEQYLRWVWHGLACPDVELIDRNVLLRRFALSARKHHYQQMQEDIAAHTPDLMILDTATPCLGVRDENDNAEATRLTDQLRAIQELAPTTLTLLILKHAKVHEDGHYSPRGAKAWLGATDATIYHLAMPGRPPNNGLRRTKLESGKGRAFSLRETIKIRPSWIGEEAHKGLILTPE